ncbi:hypothetical protein C0J52_24891 [Blattella germanica]|nr:hypothetical protein C0J52_24891 [Blattella germanica]
MDVTVIVDGWTFRRVAVDLCVSPCVSLFLWNRYNEETNSRVCARITTPQDDQYLTISTLRRRIVRPQEGRCSHSVRV